MNEIFDLVVIGSGPAGIRAAVQAAKLNKRVAIVDRNAAGGGCTFTGTIPSKSLREGALTGSDFKASWKHMRRIVAEESAVEASHLQRNRVKFLSGTARFLDSQTIEINGTKRQRLSARAYIIATGSSPIQRREYELKSAPVYNSDSILGLKALPKKLLILGAGVIGCEYASIFARLGTRVTLMDRRAELLRGVDLEVVKALLEEFEEAGIALHLGVEIGKLEKGNGARKLAITYSGRRWSGDAALVCLGREPNTRALGLDALGIALDERGQIVVNQQTFQSSVPHIYAVGDVIGPPALAATSAEQGRIAVSHLYGLETEALPKTFPYGIYTIPEISSFGAIESDLQQNKIPYVAARASFGELARGMISGERRGFLKLLVHMETREILGVHVLGAGASELVHIGQVVCALQAPVEFLVQNVFNYPTFAEAYKVAALSALNQIRNLSSRKSH